jgi:carboxyl-terminal processing protease
MFLSLQPMLDVPLAARRVGSLAALMATLGLGACHRPGAVDRGSMATAAETAAEAASCNAPAAPSAASLASTPVAEPLVTFDTAWAIIARTHWDTTYNGVNWRAVREELRPKAAAAKTTGELREVLSDMVGRLKQSHFSIIPREVSDATTGGGSAGSGSASGADQNGTTGAVLRYVDGAMVVTHAPPTSPAARAGVRSGWTLEAVQGCPIAPRLARIPTTMDPRRAAFTAFSIANQMLAGPVGDSVRATFRDASGRAQLVSIVRGREPGTMAKFGNLPPFPASLSHERVQQGGKTIGIIRFNIWMPVLSPQFDAAIDSLRDADAIIVDVRGNFGGVGGMSMGVAGHFLDSSLTIGTMQQRGVSLKFVANPRRVDTRSRGVKPFAGPVALLVDELSVSTTEIFAGGLQALGRARVFGTQTSGQALPSVPERLPNGDILYHAIADFLSPTGKPLEGDGVRPDVLTPLSRQALLDGKDPARDAALIWAAQAAKTPVKGATP